MRIFVTGASGWIGSAVIPELLDAGHEVLGLARSDRAAEKIAALGAEVHRGSLDDLGSLKAGAEAAEGVVHLGYNHDFSQMAKAADTDREAIETFASVLRGTDGPLVIASGVAGLTAIPATEADRPDASSHPRSANAQMVLDLAGEGIRSQVVRFAPTVHGEGDQGFIATLADVARRAGFAGYIEDGSNHWPAVHRLDAAALVRGAVESAPAGSVLHAVAEEGIATREIAEALGRSLGIPARSVPASKAAAHFGWIGMFFGMDIRASHEATSALLDWEPTHSGLIADIDAGYYRRVEPHSAG